MYIFVLIHATLKFHLLIIPIYRWINWVSERLRKWPKVLTREDRVILKPVPFLLSHYNSMVIYSIKCDFLLALPVTDPLTRQQVRLFLGRFCCSRVLENCFWQRNVFLMPSTFYFSIKYTTEICSWNNSYISQFFAELVKEKRKVIRVHYPWMVLSIKGDAFSHQGWQRSQSTKSRFLPTTNWQI